MTTSKDRQNAVAAAVVAELATRLPASQLRVGIDLVSTAGIADSLAHFGTRFLKRIFTSGEIEYACASPAHQLERLAARFAAKEAALKAFALADTGIAWTDLEVVRLPSGQCDMKLKGNADLAARDSGFTNVCLSMSHDSGFATAIVIAQQTDHF